MQAIPTRKVMSEIRDWEGPGHAWLAPCYQPRAPLRPSDTMAEEMESKARQAPGTRPAGRLRRCVRLEPGLE